MAADNYLIIDLASGRFHQQAGTVISAGSYNAGELVALDDDGRLDSSLLPEGGGIINPMTDSGDMIYGLIVPASNLALYSLGARASANSSYHSSNPNNTIDANDATLHDGGGPVAGASVTIDLQSPLAIGAWRLRQVPWGYDGGSVGIGVNNEHADGYTLASSDDNSTWTDRYTFVSGAPDDTGIVLFGTNITARYWRVLAATGGVWGWDIQTFGLYQVEPAVARLGIGGELQVLTVVDGLPAWADAAGGGMSNPMRAAGDLIVGRAAVDSINQALTSAGVAHATNGGYYGGSGLQHDGNDTSYGFSNTSAATGSWFSVDLLTSYRIASLRISQRTDDAVYRATALTLQSSVDGSAWDDRQSYAALGGTDSGILPLDTPHTARYWRILATAGGVAGWCVRSFELFSGTPAGAPTRLAIGDELQVLTVVSGVEAWADPTGGSGGGSTAPGILPTPDYDSGFVSMTVNVELVLSHGLGEQPSLFLLTYRDGSGSTNEKPLSLTNYPSVGVWRPSVTATEFRLFTTWSYVAYNDAGSGLATVEVRVRAWKSSSAGAALLNPMTAAGDLIIGSDGSDLTNEALLSLGAAATDNGSYMSYIPASAIDGDDTTPWFGNQAGVGWLRVDLGSAKRITAWRIYHGDNSVPLANARNFVIQSSDDDSSWTDRDTSYSTLGVSTLDTGIVSLGSPTTARYWRYYTSTHHGNGYGTGLFAFGVYSGSIPGTPVRLPLGDELQVLTVVSGMEAWADPSAGLPAIGDEGQVLTVVSGVSAWAAAATGGGGSGAVIGGGPGIIDAIYDAISISNVDPIDTIVELDDFVALIFLSSHNATTWKPASSSYTVPTDMKLIIAGVWATGAVATDPGNRRARLYNVTDSAEALGASSFQGAPAALQIPWNGDISTPSKMDEVTSGKEVRLELWNGDSNKRALGAILIMRLVPASGDYTPPLRGWSVAPGASLYLWGQYN